MSITSRFRLTANKAAAGSDRVLVFAPVLSDEDLEFVGGSRANTLSISAVPEAAAKLTKGEEYFITIAPAHAG